MMLYLDNAATTLKKPLSVYATLFKSTLFSGGNAGRGGHKMSMDAVRAIVDTQDLIAQLFNIKKAENVVFTQNATYALNTAILGRSEEHTLNSSHNNQSRMPSSA